MSASTRTALDCALELIAKGERVLPVAEGRSLAGTLDDASADEETIRRWFSRSTGDKCVGVVREEKLIVIEENFLDRFEPQRDADKVAQMLARVS